jgi:hypothetical protein
MEATRYFVYMVIEPRQSTSKEIEMTPCESVKTKSALHWITLTIMFVAFAAVALT